MTTPRNATARPNIPMPTGRRIERTQSRLRLLRIPASCAKRRCPVAGSTQVDHRAVGLEQAGGLGDGGDQLVVDLAVAAVRVVAAVAVGRARASPSGRSRVRGRVGGRGGLRARAWSGWPRAEDTPSPRTRAWPFAGVAYVIRPMPDPSRVDERRAERRPRRHVRPPTVPTRRRRDDAPRQPATPPVRPTDRGPITDVRFPHLAPRFRRRPARPHRRRSRWARPTSTRPWAACCSP